MHVAPRLALLCLQGDGRLTPSRPAAQAVRAGGLVDLVLAGRLVEEDDAVELLPGPEAGRVAEDLVAEVDADPGRPLADLVERGRAGLPEAAGELVDRGLWLPRASLLPWRGERYRPADPSLARAVLAPAVAAVRVDGATPDRAATAVLATVAGLVDGRFAEPDERLLAACGPAEWVTRTAAEVIAVSRRWHEAMGATTIADLGTPW
ncbi:Golgi phosphoprotein 3 GPP34 [Geodermatophilus normandii]|uniref:Golgi phosphoprotein 3 GPP34 n=1 Tax=Geodermatophilus normandii TaxID=1137989 RepID=A0A317QRA5_9ACTN|nr:GPP34 family phosphoprotein [Geodermatophilus normandii]PWW24240.1 Golgi phosphoprotein 3 GPP34 [Geodermatophilus normandii]